MTQDVNVIAGGDDSMEKESIVDVLPASFAQRRLWFLDQMDPNSPLYNLPITIRVDGELQAEALRRALSCIVERHEILRTSFVMHEGAPVQVIAPEVEPEFVVVDVSHLDEDTRNQELRRLEVQHAHTPFQLDRVPLLRTLLVRLSPRSHYMLVSAHHIVFDGLSSDIFFRELAALYDDEVNGRQPSLESLPLQYADYAIWQQESLEHDSIEFDLAYWKERLQGAPPTLDLPTDRARPVVQTFRGGRCPFDIPVPLASGLQSLARQVGVTPYMVLLSVFLVLLRRYTEQDDVIVGTPVAGRSEQDLQNLIGFFVNTVPLRADLSGDPTFRELLARVREITLGAFSHQDIPFELIVQNVQPERTLSHLPLVQVMFVYEQGAAPSASAGESTWHMLNSPERLAGHLERIAKFDLTLGLTESGERLRGYIEFSADLFDEATIGRMVGHFTRLLESAVAAPDTPMSALSMLSEAERRHLVVDEYVELAEYPVDRCIHEVFAERAANTPQAMAVTYEDRSLTYHELDMRANQLANRLRGFGVGPDVLVGICVERSIEMIVGLLAILKAGGAYVPLDPAYPTDRLAFVLADTNAPVILTQAHLQDRLGDSDAHRILLDEDWSDLAHESTESPETTTQPDNLAYVVYTSGSTGRPKGVLITHRNVVRLFSATDQWFHFGANDVWTLFHSYAFDFSVWEMWGALLYGGRLVVVPYLVSRSPEAFHALLRRERVTVLNQTPSAFKQLIQIDESAGAEDDLFLRYIIFGGEALDFSSLRPWFDRHPDTDPQLVNMYGITETTVHVTYHPVRAADIGASGSSVGTPIPDLQVYIVDGRLEPVPVGVPGEMLVGGAGVARGYLNRPELTDERFIASPFREEERVYRTGDRARYRANGSIEYLGRLDQQVKIRGYRIELGEIEALLGQVDGIQEAVVVPREERDGDRRLVAYVVAEPGHDPNPEDLRQYLKEKLPDYMVPSAYVFLEKMPLTSNGKLDRASLPAPSTQNAPFAEKFIPPRTPLHLQLAHIWQQLLGIERISIRDNFFDLGGHSLLAVRLLDQIHRSTGKRLSLMTLFEEPTIEHLTNALLRAEQPGVQPLTVEVQRGGDRTPLFFVHGDLGGGGLYCWRLARLLDRDQPFYTLEPFGPNGRSIPDTVQQMAASYVAAIRDVRPNGPYLIGGFCIGGLIAYEITQQLTAQGEQVELLFMIDGEHSEFAARLARIAITSASRLGILDARSRIEIFTWLRALNEHRANWRYLLRHATRHNHPDSGPEWLTRFRMLSRLARSVSTQPLTAMAEAEGALPEHVEAYAWAAAGYWPRPYAGRGELIWSSGDIELAGKDPTLGWKRFIPDVTSHVAPGVHLTTITVHVDSLAKIMQRSIDQLRPAIRTGPGTHDLPNSGGSLAS